MPLLYIFAFLAISELLVVHWLVSAWSVPIAFALSAITALSLVAIGYLGMWAVLRPLVLTGEGIFIPGAGPAGTLLTFENISEIRHIAFSPEPKGKGNWRRTALAHPNFLLCLRSPVARRTLVRTRMIESVSVRVDDPARFAPAVQSRLG